MNNKCFCHLSDTKGHRYEVKDAQARRDIEQLKKGAGSGLKFNTLENEIMLDPELYGDNGMPFSVAIPATHRPLYIDIVFNVELWGDIEQSIARVPIKSSLASYTNLNFSSKLSGGSSLKSLNYSNNILTGYLDLNGNTPDNCTIITVSYLYEELE